MSWSLGLRPGVFSFFPFAVEYINITSISELQSLFTSLLVSLSSPFVPSFVVSSTLIYCCISVSLFSFSYSFPVLLVCCFVCLFSFMSSPVIVFTCASFPSCGHFPCQSPVSCQCSVSIYSPVLPLSTHLFVPLCLCVPATQTF